MEGAGVDGTKGRADGVGGMEGRHKVPGVDGIAFGVTGTMGRHDACVDGTGRAACVLGWKGSAGPGANAK